ncbi:MAG: hypothetical protein ACAF41_27190 [Leptolyngbya sp. BL-A-14]
MSAEQPSPEPTTPEWSESSSAIDAQSDPPPDQTETDRELVKSSERSADASVHASSEQTEADVESTKPPAPAEPLPSPIDARSSAARRPRATNDEILPQTLLRLAGETIVAAQPFVKQQGIKALKGTIHLLEQVVERLEAEPLPKPTAGRAPVPEDAPENALPPFSQTRPGKLVPPLSTETLQEKFRSLWQQLRRSWKGVLRQVRDRLPASIRRTWSDQALTGAIVGLAVLLLWTTTSIVSPKPPQPTAIAEAPPAETLVTLPSPTPTPIPPVVTAPEAPKPIESSPPPVVPAPPPPPLKLTPEQTLIARIQNQVAAISNQYANGLVESIQANFRGSRLIVHISDDWYGLSRSQQDKLASEILNRTRNLDFLKLELVDSSGKLLARSPVVGPEMIILRRTTEAVEAA